MIVKAISLVVVQAIWRDIPYALLNRLSGDNFANGFCTLIVARWSLFPGSLTVLRQLVLCWIERTVKRSMKHGLRRALQSCGRRARSQETLAPTRLRSWCSVLATHQGPRGAQLGGNSCLHHFEFFGDFWYGWPESVSKPPSRLRQLTGQDVRRIQLMRI